MKKKEAQTEQKIFDSASEIFSKKGFDGARMQEIADHAGINKALLHYYYRSKEKLFTAVFTLVAKKIFKKIFSFFSDPNITLEEKIQMFYKEHISLLLKNPGLPAFLINETNKNPALIKQIFQSDEFSQIISVNKKQYIQGVNSGKFQDYGPVNFFINIVSMSLFPFTAHGIVKFIMAQQGFDFKEVMEQRKTVLPQFVHNALKKQDK